MPRRHHDLFDRICAMDNLRAAYGRTAAGRRQTVSYLHFREESEVELAALHHELRTGIYHPQPYFHFTVCEPKVREVSALSFRDRVVQHALCGIVAPLFERTFYPRSYACQTGKGTHAGAAAVQHELRSAIRRDGDCYFLKTDFKGYFNNIDRARLWREIDRRIACRSTLALIERFTPRAGCGLPIGNLTSQLWANVYGHAFDRWLSAQSLRWHRYMDDVVILGGTDWRAMLALLHRLRAYVATELGLDLSRWMVAHWQRGINFLGYRIWPTHRLLRRSSVTRARRQLRRLDRAGDPAGRQRFLGAWLGHARHASTHNLLCNLNLAPS